MQYTKYKYMIIPIILLCSYQQINAMTLEVIMNEAREQIKFTRDIEWDSSSISYNFNFKTLKAEKSIEKKSFYKLFFKEGELVKLEFINDSTSLNKNYIAYFINRDTITYYVLLSYNNDNELVFYPHFGAVITKDSCNLIFAFHRDLNGTTVQSIKDISIDKIYNYKMWPVSIFTVNESLDPMARIYFVHAQCISWSYCEMNDNSCREYINALGVKNIYPFRDAVNFSNIDTSKLLFLTRETRYSAYFLATYEFPLLHCFNWEYYRVYINYDFNK
jgi:hypothetical protein